MDDRSERPQVLLVEDDFLIRDVIVRTLEIDLGVEVAEAADGALALELAERMRPDLVLLDVNLPKIDGLEVTRRLRSSVTTRSIPVVAVTCAPQADTEAAGCDAHLAKPFDLDDLVAITMAHIRGRRGGKA
jgi:CheY-like chemotaxis protein